MTNRLLTVLLVLALIAAGYWYITTPKANGGDIAMRTLQAAGYENIQLSPAYVLSGCNEGDTPIANFTATQNGATALS